MFPYIFLAGPEPEMAEVVPPRFIEALKPQIVAEGEVVIMETHVESHPTCSFQWFQHSVPVKVSNLDLNKYILDSVYHITVVVPSKKLDDNHSIFKTVISRVASGIS